MPPLRNAGIFYVRWPISHFYAVFRHFPGPGGISYCPANKSVLKRKFAKINFFMQNIGKTFGN